jgi:hypothetical protein
VVDARPIARRLLALVLEELTWLEDDGYQRLGVMDLESRFTANYGGPRGRVAVAVDAARATVEVWLAPPDPSDPAAPLDFLRGDRVMLEALLRRDGQPAPGGSWGAPDAADRVVSAQLAALRGYRDGELAGDWSGLEAARTAGRAARRDAAEQIRDPMMRGIMRGYRRGSGGGSGGGSGDAR